MSKREQTDVPCEACGKPVRGGHYVNLYDDVGEVHVDCDAPDKLPTEPTIGEDKHGREGPLQTYLLTGHPLRLEPVEEAAE